VDSPRLAPKNNYSTGPYVPRAQREGGGGFYSSYRSNEEGVPPERGAVGLRNLGNTCFMNSTLQCLSNTPGFVQFFAEKKYATQINTKNALGWGGKVANSYGELVQAMWSGKYRTVAPATFKDVIGEFQPRFSGYQQHDSSELLSFLLDGLHEDLNRVVDKPYTKVIDSAGRADPLVAKEAWHRHLLRNQSIVVDMFQGQLKSQVVCPDCKSESITFDPFMFLSIPLPGSDNSAQWNTITFVPAPNDVLEKALPRRMPIKVSKHGGIKEFKELMAKETGTVAKELVVYEVYKQSIYQFFRDEQKIFGAHDDIWVAHVPRLSEVKEGSGGAEPVYRAMPLNLYAMAPNSKYRRLGPPIIMTLPYASLKALPISELRAAIRPVIAPFLVGGWKDGEDDTATYLLEVMEESSLKGELDLKTETTIDITERTRNPAFGIFFLMDKIERYVDASRVPQVVSGGATSKAKQEIDVGMCIDLLTTQEVLPESEAYFCAKCKAHKCATKKFDLWMLPDILIIHLKRFSFDRAWREKLEDYVDFPLEGLDLSKWVVNSEEKKDCVYDLYAVSNHYGGLGGGHYTAFAKNLLNQKWYNLDDSSVSPVDRPESVKTKAAYVLFYARKKKKGRTYAPKEFE